MDANTMAMLARQLSNGGAIGPAEQASPVDQSTNPLVNTLLSQMNNSSADTERVDHAERLERQLVAAKRRISKLRASIAAAEQMVELIAVTFGTCPECWGLNQLCRLCRGQGGPGWRPPDTGELLSWVEPALAYSGLHVEPNNSRLSTVEEPGNGEQDALPRRHR